MILLEDTRNKVGDHKNIYAYCERIGIVIRRSKLYVGDYQIADKGDIAIDTKQNVLELANNVFQEHERFRNECIRAKEAGIQLIILVEESLPEGRLDKWVSPTWKSTTRYHRYGEPMSRVNPVALRKAMMTMQHEYGVKFRFCDHHATGKRVIQYLKGELK